mmetsp:Transcript_35916/g.66417  ORF Transcript_35916/g.66417 Transcript_35916/m.66417 type:complete len:334 (-) Transcript_35916:402-1403(-)
MHLNKQKEKWRLSLMVHFSPCWRLRSACSASSRLFSSAISLFLCALSLFILARSFFLALLDSFSALRFAAAAAWSFCHSVCSASITAALPTSLRFFSRCLSSALCFFSLSFTAYACFSSKVICAKLAGFLLFFFFAGAPANDLPAFRRFTMSFMSSSSSSSGFSWTSMASPTHVHWSPFHWYTIGLPPSFTTCTSPFFEPSLVSSEDFGGSLLTSTDDDFSFCLSFLSCSPSSPSLSGSSTFITLFSLSSPVFSSATPSCSVSAFAFSTSIAVASSAFLASSALLASSAFLRSSASFARRASLSFLRFSACISNRFCSCFHSNSSRSFLLKPA